MLYGVVERQRPGVGHYSTSSAARATILLRAAVDVAKDQLAVLPGLEEISPVKASLEIALRIFLAIELCCGLRSIWTTSGRLGSILSPEGFFP